MYTRDSISVEYVYCICYNCRSVLELCIKGQVDQAQSPNTRTNPHDMMMVRCNAMSMTDDEFRRSAQVYPSAATAAEAIPMVRYNTMAWKDDEYKIY